MDSPYFDSSYFDPSYFDTDAAAAVVGGSASKSARPSRMQILPIPEPEPVDPEDWVVLIL